MQKEKNKTEVTLPSKFSNNDIELIISFRGKSSGKVIDKRSLLSFIINLIEGGLPLIF